MSISAVGGQTSDWHIRFQIPLKETYSWSVQKAVETGVIARKEIVQVLRTLILSYTKYPTSEQYTTISQKLVEKIPKLKDPVG